MSTAYPIELTEKSQAAIEECSCGICGRTAHASILSPRMPVCPDCPEWDLAQVEPPETTAEFLARVKMPTLYEVAQSMVMHVCDPLNVHGKVVWQ